MSQKTNPTSLRLQKNNQNFSSPLFADFFFTENYHYNFEIEKYITAFLKQTQYSKAFFSAKNQYRSFSVWLFLQDCRADKKSKQLFFRYKSFKKPKSSQDLSKTEVFRVLNETENNKNSVFIRQDILQKTAKQVDSFAKAFPKGASFDRLWRKNPFRDANQRFATLWGCKSEIYMPSDKRRGSQERNTEQWIQNKYSFLSFINFTSPNSVTKYCQQFFRFSSFFTKKVFLQNQKNDKIYLEQAEQSNNKNIEKQVSENGAWVRNYLRNHFLKLKQSARFSSNLLGVTNKRFVSGVLADKPEQLIQSLNLNPSFRLLHIFSDLNNCKQSKKHQLLFTFLLLKLFPLGTQIRDLQPFGVCEAFPRRGANQRFATKGVREAISFSSSNSNFFNTVRIQPVRFIRDRQNVMSLLDQVIILLEKRIAWRQIKSFLFKDLSKDLQISGVRFSCSGRLGGRSKKAQKAKMQSASFGETSLSAFSSKLIFGSKSAFTPYGKIGVKLWVCYRC